MSDAATPTMKIMAIAPWFDITDYALSLVRDGTLRIDTEGRIWRDYERSKKGRKKIEPRRAESRTGKGYLVVVLGVPGTRRTRSISAHRLVWIARNGPIPDGLQVNHKDMNRTNNHLSNLEIVNQSENIRHSYRNGRVKPWHKAMEWRPGVPRLTDAQKIEVLALRQSGHTYRSIQTQTGISQAHIGRILKGGAR